VIAIVLMLIGWFITIASGLLALFHVLEAVPALQVWSMGITLVLLGLQILVLRILGGRRY
jgi:hypothetical protein